MACGRARTRRRGSASAGERSIRIGIDDALLTPRTRAIKRDLEAGRTAAAWRAIKKKHGARKDADVYTMLAKAAELQLSPTTEQLTALHRARDAYGARRVLQATSRRFAGMPLYDAMDHLITTWLDQDSADELLAAGRIFYRVYETAAKSRRDGDLKRLAGLAARYPDTVYGRRAQAAAEWIRKSARPGPPEEFLAR